eukprot:TCALIF_03103-PA protein Name:"Similar to Zfp2 Zinc finger protein 2 (Mus musculus)" AED:0.14 eAED:0.14 QI:0/0.83/0.71/0.85/0.83/0.85/7/943/793
MNAEHSYRQSSGENPNDTSVEELEEILNDFTSLLEDSSKSSAPHQDIAHHQPNNNEANRKYDKRNNGNDHVVMSSPSHPGDSFSNGFKATRSPKNQEKEANNFPVNGHGVRSNNCPAMHHIERKHPPNNAGQHPIINASLHEISPTFSLPSFTKISANLLGASVSTNDDRVRKNEGQLVNNGLEMPMDGLILGASTASEGAQMQLQGKMTAQTSHYQGGNLNGRLAVEGSFDHCILGSDNVTREAKSETEKKCPNKPTTKTNDSTIVASAVITSPTLSSLSSGHHVPLPPQPSTPPPSQPAQCQLCGWNFDDEHFLQLHTALMHSGSHPDEEEGTTTTRTPWTDKLIRDSRDKRHSGALTPGANGHHPNALWPNQGDEKSCEEYGCRFCDEIFTSFDNYKIHLRSAHNDQRFICKTCGKLFKLRGSLLVHERVVHNPNGQGTFHCSICNRKFNNKYRRDIHEKSHGATDEFHPTVGEKLTCVKCNLDFNDRGSYDIHVAGHRFHCQVCSQGFETNSELVLHSVSHIRQSRGDPDSLLPTVPLKQGVTCSQCSKVFPTEIQLTQHMRLHTGGRHWECKVCQKSFTTKYFLKKHNRLHTGETPYRCKICDRAFTFQQSFHKHMLYHSDEKPYTCSQCGRSFKELSTLQNHERIHSGERPFQCETCGKSFRQRVSYLVHRRIHTGVMPYKCTVCGKCFRYKVTQRTHKCPGDSEETNELSPKPATPADQPIAKELSDHPNFPTLPNKLRQDLLKFRKQRTRNWKFTPKEETTTSEQAQPQPLFAEEVIRFSLPDHL